MTAEEARAKVGELEAEDHLLGEILASPLWQHIEAKWRPVIIDCQREILDRSYEHRTWQAGHITGMLKILDYPQTRRKNIADLIKNFNRYLA